MATVEASDTAMSHAWEMPEGGRPSARYVRIAFVTLLLLLVYWGNIKTNLISRWLSDGDWSHGWLIPVISLYFLIVRRDELRRCHAQPSYLGAVILALSLAVYFLSAWRLRMTYPQTLSLVGAIFGLTLLMGGWAIIRVAALPILYLLFAVPIPQSVYVGITMPLRKLASTISAAVMPLFAPGLHTEAQAVVIDYVMPGSPPGSLNVEEACSGMRLMVAFAALGVAMAYLQERPTWQRVVMIASCIPVAVFCNAVRVTTTGLFHVYGAPSLARGTPHQLLGVATLGLALGLFALIGYVLSHLFVEAPGEPEA